MLLNKQARCGSVATLLNMGKKNLWILKDAKAEAVTRAGGTTFTFAPSHLCCAMSVTASWELRRCTISKIAAVTLKVYVMLFATSSHVGP